MKLARHRGSAYNPSYSGHRDGREIVVQGQPRRNAHETPSQTMTLCVGACLSSLEAQQEMAVRAGLDVKRDPSSNLPSTKRAATMAPVVACLPSKA
jgi:hypothetical protein